MLEKIRSQPEHIRKIILWSVIIIVGLVLLTFWVKDFQQRIRGFEMGEFKKELPKIEIPQLEMPKFDESR